MANYNFKEDIEIGEQGEGVVIKDLKRLNGKFINDNKDINYDLIMEMPSGEVIYEIKTDVYCFPDKDTGNIFIEYECRGKDSGINATKADFFVTYFKYMNEIWYIKTDKLKKIITENKFRTTEQSGDAGSNTKGYLIPRYKFKKSFIVRKVPKEWQNQN
jgi:hypothetical protein